MVIKAGPRGKKKPDWVLVMLGAFDNSFSEFLGDKTTPKIKRKTHRGSGEVQSHFLFPAIRIASPGVAQLQCIVRRVYYAFWLAALLRWTCISNRFILFEENKRFCKLFRGNFFSIVF